VRPPIRADRATGRLAPRVPERRGTKRVHAIERCAAGTKTLAVPAQVVGPESSRADEYNHGGGILDV